ncbi:hypothetical protein TREES_T100020935 [Tupaia chinensis]|uniref:Uncharacterized protein n=1 Tax=Tupaia chinensis TaxID=246437 RepID=L9JDB7_TUPCH|nr:hypothetical protein TREES_T100020935 [Tupaia chinensis]
MQMSGHGGHGRGDCGAVLIVHLPAPPSPGYASTIPLFCALWSATSTVKDLPPILVGRVLHHPVSTWDVWVHVHGISVQLVGRGLQL